MSELSFKGYDLDVSIGGGSANVLKVVPLLKSKKKAKNGYRIHTLQLQVHMGLAPDATELFRGYILFVAGLADTIGGANVTTSTAEFLGLHSDVGAQGLPLFWKKHVIWSRKYVEFFQLSGANNALSYAQIGTEGEITFPGGLLIPRSLSIVSYFFPGGQTTTATLRMQGQAVYEEEQIPPKLYDSLLRKYTVYDQVQTNPGIGGDV